jgi:hypothetical protein
MTRRASPSVLASEFDNFLFAPIGDDQNDMPLSVLSALARLNIDPWKEAAELAQLPRETATRRLASSIGALLDGPTVHLEHGEIAARLIALLPRQGGSSIQACGTSSGVVEITQFRISLWTIAVFLVFTLVSQWIVASSQTSARLVNANTMASSKASPQLPSPNDSR